LGFLPRQLSWHDRYRSALRQGLREPNDVLVGVFQHEVTMTPRLLLDGLEDPNFETLCCFQQIIEPFIDPQLSLSGRLESELSLRSTDKMYRHSVAMEHGVVGAVVSFMNERGFKATHSAVPLDGRRHISDRVNWIGSGESHGELGETAVMVMRSVT